MRKVLLMMMCMATFMIAQAQDDFTTVWGSSLDLPRDYADAKSSDLMAFDNNGNLYATGIFNKEFTFGNTILENLATSTYLIKYSADGSKLWGATFFGAATPSAITTDVTGNIYIAGTFADEVVFKGTDETEITKMGILNEGAPVTFQGAGFIAKYDADGKLLNVETFIPSPLSGELTNYYPYDNKSLLFKITDLVYSDKLYASAIVAGVVNSNNIEFTGTYNSSFGDNADVANAYVFSLSPTLVADKAEQSLIFKEAAIIPYTVDNVKICLNNNDLFAAFSGFGEASIVVNGVTTPAGFPAEVDEDMFMFNFARGILVTKTDLPAGSLLQHKVYATDIVDYYSMYSLYFSLIDASLSNSELVISGSYNDKFPFDSSINKENYTFYTASLNNSDFSLINKISGDYAEGIEATSAVVSNDLVIAYGKNDKGDSFEFIASLSENLSSIEGAEDYCTGLASKDGKISMASVSDLNETTDTGKLNFMVIQTPNPSSISSVGQDAGIIVYPNPVIDVLNFTASCNVVVSNLMGMPVKRADNVNSLLMSDLTNGQYLVTVTTDDGVSVFKIIKK